MGRGWTRLPIGRALAALPEHAGELIVLVNDADLEHERGASEAMRQTGQLEVAGLRTAANPGFAHILVAARERRALIAQLAAKRRELNIPQAEVARRMITSQAFVSRFEQARSIRSTPLSVQASKPLGKCAALARVGPSCVFVRPSVSGVQM
jgi:DNA-binding transcriptional regulator YiaG